MGFTCPICRLSIRSPGQPQGRKTHAADGGQGDVGFAGRSGRWKGGHDAIPPTGTQPTSSFVVSPRSRARSGHGLACVRPPTILGDRASGVVHHAAGRNIAYPITPARVPDSTRATSTLTRGHPGLSAARVLHGVSHGVSCSGGHPAHQAGRLLHCLIWKIKRPTGRAVPRRGFTRAGR